MSKGCSSLWIILSRSFILKQQQHSAKLSLSQTKMFLIWIKTWAIVKAKEKPEERQWVNEMS